MAGILRVQGITMAPAVMVTVIMAMQIIFLLIGQYTVLSHIQPGVGNWVEITGILFKIDENSITLHFNVQKSYVHYK